ncbi:MAG: hemerythrin domain-containing protein, partial [Bacteroidota bacterium]|nr:hemerythrin domain-containing protein [Bacteroidota bacterium]
YTKAKIPHIKRNLERLGESEILSVFQRFSRDMQKHMLLEEKVIFPFILRLVELNEEFDLNAATELLETYSTDVLGSSHTQDDDEMKELREVTKHYQSSETDSIVYQVVMTDLARLEEDIFRHARVEDQILFKKAKREENLLRQRIVREQHRNNHQT